MDIVVKGRNVEVPDHFRQHVHEKLSRAERYDHKLIRVDVELFHEPNPRQVHACQRVEITCKSRGPVIRSEACAENFYAALDTAIAKLESRLSRAADRRRVHHGRRTPISVAVATAQTVDALVPLPPSAAGADLGDGAVAVLDGAEAAPVEDGAAERVPGRIVRRKEHAAKPMTVDEALFEMELVGHDFYLFSDVDTGRPSVVYCRKGYDYGVISLAP